MRFERMAVRLKLTSAQESQIKADLKQARTNARPAIDSMRNMRGTLAKQIFVDQPDQAAIQQNADQLKQQLSTMIDEYVKAGLQINERAQLRAARRGAEDHRRAPGTGAEAGSPLARA